MKDVFCLFFLKIRKKFFKIFIDVVTILLPFLVFGCETHGILAPQPEIELLSPPAVEGKILITGL